MKKTDRILNEHWIPFIPTNGCNSMQYYDIWAEVDITIAAFHQSR